MLSEVFKYKYIYRLYRLYIQSKYVVSCVQMLLTDGAVLVGISGLLLSPASSSPRGNQMLRLEVTGRTQWSQMKFADLLLSQFRTFPFLRAAPLMN